MAEKFSYLDANVLLQVKAAPAKNVCPGYPYKSRPKGPFVAVNVLRFPVP
jgi:hypothetical protein